MMDELKHMILIILPRFTRFLYKIISIVLIVSFIYSCQKEEVDNLVDYNKFTAEVGQEGRTLQFFESNSNIPENMFPVLEIEPNTFEDTAVIKMYYSQIASGNIPMELTSISENNLMWYFKSNYPVLKPIELTIYFSEPDKYVRLNNYKHLFKLYNIIPGNDTKKISNWSTAKNYSLDTLNNSFSIGINNFQYAYCVFFEEISIENLFILSVSGSINDTYRDVSGGVVKFMKDEEYLYCFINENGISYYSTANKSKNVDFSIAFSFNGSETGIYTGYDVTAEYCYQKDSLDENWIHIFNYPKNMTININEYGKMGEMVKGNINGALYNTNNDSIEMNMEFEFTRVR